MEALQGRDGDKDDNSLLAVADFDLIKIPKSACELHDKVLDRFPSCSNKGQLYAGMRGTFLPRTEGQAILSNRSSSALKGERFFHPRAPLFGFWGNRSMRNISAVVFISSS